jgi:hypothetical protein
MPYDVFLFEGETDKNDVRLRPAIVPVPIIEVPKGIVTKKKWVFEYSFLYTTTEKSVHVCSKVLEEGAYVWFNALNFFMDKELKYPIELSLNAMLENLTYEVDGENIVLREIVENLAVGELFSWIIHGSLKSGSKFKVLFTLKKPKVFKPPYASFGIKGKGRRNGTS